MNLRFLFKPGVEGLRIPNSPIAKGLIENWDNMERMWQRSIFDYLRCDPADDSVPLLAQDASLLPDLLDVFAQVVLPARRCKYVQFVWSRRGSCGHRVDFRAKEVCVKTHEAS